MSQYIKNIARLWVIGVLLACFAERGEATNYYVDYSAGSDASVGTSTDTAWQHCPGDPSATGNAATASLSPGDTVYFKGGVTYVLTAPYAGPAGSPGIALKWDGTANYPITYDGNSAGTWGTGRAILTDNGGTNYISAFMKLPYADANFVNFSSFEIGPIGGSLVLPPDPGGTTYNPNGIPANPGWGIIGFGAFNNVTISNCYFHSLGYWFNQKPMGANSISGGGIVCHGCYGLTVTNCEFAKVARGLQVLISAPVTNLTVANCAFQSYTVWAIDLGVQSPTAGIDGVAIHDNQFNDIGLQYANGVWTGYGQGPHQNAIFFRADSVTNVVCGPNINVFNNEFKNTTNAAGGTSSIFLVGNTSMNIYNNLFARNSVANGVITVNLSETNVYYYLRILNNTFYEDSSTTFYLGCIGNSSNTNYLVQVENNILSQVESGYNGWSIVFGSPYIPPPSVYNFDYNCYVSSNWNNNAVGFYSAASAAYMTMAWMQAHNWESHGIQVDPQFANILGLDFHLLPTSLALYAGKNLSSLNLPGLHLDKDGNPRPSTLSSNWAIGAYQVPESLLNNSGTNAPVVTLTALPNAVTNGQAFTLNWATANATNVTLVGIGTVALSGSTNLVANINGLSSSYNIIAVGAGGTNSATVTISLRPSPPSGLKILNTSGS